MALDADRVVGATSTFRLDFDFNHVDYTFADIIQGGWLTSHIRVDMTFLAGNKVCER